MQRRSLTYYWIAFFRDGSVLPQFETDGKTEHYFREVDKSKLAAFGWIPFSPALPKFVMRLNEGQELLDPVKRHTLNLSEGKEEPMIYLLGYRQGDKQFIMFIREDGTFELHDDFNFR